MKFKIQLLAIVLASAAIVASNAAFAVCSTGTVGLPAPGPTTSITFGDGISYSLPLLGINVKSGPGQIDDCIMVATGQNGVNATTNITGMDHAYDTNQPPGSIPYFRTGDPAQSPDPGQVAPFTGDTADSWDIRLDALKSYLGNTGLVVFFNHAQQGAPNDPTDPAQDLFIWAQIRLVDTDGIAPTQYFYVTSVPNATGLTNFGTPTGLGPFGLPTAYTGPQVLAGTNYPTSTDGTCSTTPSATSFPSGDVGTGTGNLDACFFVRARGRICLSPGGIPVPCDANGQPPPGGSFVNDNTGSNEASNAIIFPEIQAILDLAGFGGYDVLQADIRMGCNPATVGTSGCPGGSVMNGGNEQIFIGGFLREQVEVPAPGTLALVGLGLLGLGMRVRRRA